MPHILNPKCQASREHNFYWKRDAKKRSPHMYVEYWNDTLGSSLININQIYKYLHNNPNTSSVRKIWIRSMLMNLKTTIIITEKAAIEKTTWSSGWFLYQLLLIAYMIILVVLPENSDFSDYPPAILSTRISLNSEGFRHIYYEHDWSFWYELCYQLLQCSLVFICRFSTKIGLKLF